jgi:hypothetical protein
MWSAAHQIQALSLIVTYLENSKQGPYICPTHFARGNSAFVGVPFSIFVGLIVGRNNS